MKKAEYEIPASNYGTAPAVGDTLSPNAHTGTVPPVPVPSLWIIAHAKVALSAMDQSFYTF